MLDRKSSPLNCHPFHRFMGDTIQSIYGDDCVSLVQHFPERIRNTTRILNRSLSSSDTESSCSVRAPGPDPSVWNLSSEVFVSCLVALLGGQKVSEVGSLCIGSRMRH